MTPLWAGLLPLAELAATLLLIQRIGTRRYPALVVYLATEALWHFVASVEPHGWLIRSAHPLRMAVRTWVVVELFRLCRVDMAPERWARVIGSLSALCAMTALIFSHHMPAFNQFSIFREYYQIGLAVALAALCMGAWPRMRVVSRERDAYLLGMAIWFAVLAISGTFVAGGLAYAPLRDIGASGWGLLTVDFSRIWQAVNLATYAALTLTVAGLAWGMTRQPNQRLASERAGLVLVKRAA